MNEEKGVSVEQADNDLLDEIKMSPSEKRLIKKESEKNRFLKHLEEGDLRTMTARVAFILNHYPETRDSDLLLTLLYWETFQNELYNNGKFTKETYLKLEQQSDITRARAKVQNDFGAFQSSEKVRVRRSEREETYRTDQVDLSESSTPTSYIFCDESGKTQDFVLMGSLWGHETELGTLRRAIADFRVRLEWGFKDEFHFVDVDKKNVELYKELVDIVADHSSTIGFKAICFKKAGSSLKIDDIVTKLYLVGICDGLNHEIETGRADIPRTLNILKDKEDTKDNLILETQRLELQTHITSMFDRKVYLGYLNALPSYSNNFLQVVDVFTGCLSRRLNTPNGRQPKDELAVYFFEKFNIDPETLISNGYDFINIRFLN